MGFRLVEHYCGGLVKIRHPPVRHTFFLVPNAVRARPCGGNSVVADRRSKQSFAPNIRSQTEFGNEKVMKHDVEQHGFSVFPRAIDADEQRALLAALGPDSGAGRRGLLALPVVAELARSTRLLALVRPHVPSEPLPVRAIFFNKCPETNWLVPWHQDLSLAVRTKAEIPGFGPWSTKDGIPHVRPPPELLQQMLTVRLHFDDADESNGALRVLPGSHRFGRLSAERIRQFRREQTDFVCAVSVGDALLMRPLLVHASSRSTSTRPRRVLHIEYAAFTLPAGLDWHDAA